jgi:iron complex transport system substrate-binding protein
MKIIIINNENQYQNTSEKRREQMKNRLFKLFIITLALFVGLGSFPFAQVEAASTIKVLKDGKAITFNTNPKIMNGTTMVPYREIAESLGASVKWDANTKTVTVTKSGKVINLQIKNKYAKIQNQYIYIGVAPVIENGRTLIPLRFLSEAFGLWVSWNGSTKTITIDSSKVIAHAMGKTKLNGTPQKVVVLFNGMVDISLTLGVKPVGAVESWVQKPFYNYLRNQLNGVKNLGLETQPNLEAIIALKPDLIIGSKMRHEKIYSQLSNIAPTIMTEDVFSWKENLKMASGALNKEAVGQKFLADWNKQVADFKKKMGSRLKTEVSLVRFDPDHARIYYTGFAGTIIEEVGLARPESQRVKDKVIAKLTSKEQIPLMDGDIIFNFTSDWKGDGDVFKTQNEWTSHALWKNLNAVKKGKVYEVNDVTWNMSGGAMAAKDMLDSLYFYFDLER